MMFANILIKLTAIVDTSSQGSSIFHFFIDSAWQSHICCVAVYQRRK